MKTYHSLLSISLFLLILSACGTTASLNERHTYVQYASVQVTESEVVVGRLLKLDNSIIAIAVDGVYMEYYHDDIISFEWYDAPNPDLMQRDIVKNTSRTASHTDFYTILTVIGLAVTSILVMITLTSA